MVNPRAAITAHFRWGEMLRTDHRQFLDQQANPPPVIRDNIVRFCGEVLEPVRRIVGPLMVHSGYRCPDLNAAIGGSPTSAHMQGCAADVHTISCSLLDAYERLADARLDGLDQIIFEFSRWIHIGGAVPGQKARGQRLMIFEPGKYLPWNPKHPRVAALRRPA